MSFPRGEVLGVVSSGVGEDLGAALEEESSDVFVTELTGEGEGVEVLVCRRRRLEADSLVDEGLHDGTASVRDRVDDGAVPVEVGDGRVGASGDEKLTHLSVSVDGSVVEGVATVDVGLGDGDTLRETGANEGKSTGTRRLGDGTPSATAQGESEDMETNLMKTRATVNVVDVSKVEKCSRDRSIRRKESIGCRLRPIIVHLWCGSRRVGAIFDEDGPPEDPRDGRAKVGRSSSVPWCEERLEEVVDSGLVTSLDGEDECVLQILERLGTVTLLEVHRPNGV